MLISLSMLSAQPVESQVEVKHVDGLLAEKTPLVVVGTALDEGCDLAERQVASLGHSWGLEIGVGDRDVGVKPGR
jgi:hypothetical protein